MHNRRLETDVDFQEALDRKSSIRVFQDDQIVDSGCSIIRFNESYVVTQSGVGDLTYHERQLCEFFEMRKR